MSEYPGWFTKAEAAHEIGVAEKTIERMASRRELEQATRTRVGLPPVAVFHPDDVRREKQRRQPKPVPYVVPASDTQEVALRPNTDLMAAIVGRLTDTWGPPLFLTTEQAVRYTGTSAGYLDRLVKQGKLQRVEKGLRGYRYRRADLDAL